MRSLEAEHKKFKFKYMKGHPNILMHKLNSHKTKYYVRMTDFSVSIIHENIKHFYCIDSEFQKYLYLPRLVKKDFKSWLDSGKKLDSEMFGYRIMWDNCMFDKSRKTIKYDVNHAYWQIAYNEGFISEKTYRHGLKIKESAEAMKKMYCIALSVQGSPETYLECVDDKKTGEKISFSGNYEMRRVYDYIRNKTYFHMDKLAYALKGDFKSYCVDCIEFADTKKNRTFVSNYFKENNLDFKIQK